MSKNDPTIPRHFRAVTDYRFKIVSFTCPNCNSSMINTRFGTHVCVECWYLERR